MRHKLLILEGEEEPGLAVPHRRIRQDCKRRWIVSRQAEKGHWRTRRAVIPHIIWQLDVL